MVGVFLLGICIIYPNGLFNSYCFAVGPFAEYFASVFGCLVEGMNSCIVFTSRYVLECCCYNISFDVFLYKCSVVYRTFFSVYFLNCGSHYPIIAFLLASPVQTIEQASHDVISECRYTFCIVRNSIVMVITS